MCDKEEFFCVSCNTRHNISELGRKAMRFGVPYYKCKTAIENSAHADLETVARVKLEEETQEHGACKCGADEQLFDGRCFECSEKLENMKNKALTLPPKEMKLSPPDLMERYDTIKDVCEGSEANRLLAIH